MMSKETLKRLGILGVSFGLIASPLAFGDMHEDPAAQSTGSAADPATQQADPASGDPAADPNAQGDPAAADPTTGDPAGGDPAVPGDDPATQGTDSAADPTTQQADPAAGEPAGDPNAQGDPAQDPGFGEGTEAMPGAEEEYENVEEEAPWDEEGDDSEDEEQGW
ncbi:hypothetical protein [Halomonas rhizosphaerae]|uniref:Uncharacterized protein n=1 Tax=Halomonas rhizosphaerae TaxID=3043296 RepID=A0ABT6UU87_9GAMM|nr:hypothetical protein [Halomonas rhizosphaerae]MDI5889516.1 hypothetical protein [Halomonas rhizosphaerae]